MNRNVTKILLIIFSVALIAELAFVGVMHSKADDADVSLSTSEPTEEIIFVPTAGPTEEPTEAPTETEPEETEPTETESTEQRYTLTFAGDCTLGSTASKWNASSSFIQTIGDDYEYPFKNVASIFEEDDFTIVNLEGPLTETGTAAQKTFAFRGPTAYTQILTSSSVEAVTLANNHAEDYGKEGYKNTTKVLNEAGVSYVEKNDTTLIETESGLKIGLYAASFDFNKSDMVNDIGLLRQQGAEIVICAFHWGTEGAYRPNSTQEYFGRAAIEAGADIVYGSHPHVLQKVEQYQEGYIFYSLGNFSFGGSTFPQDYDSAILQMEVIRDEEGNVSLGELTMIPVSISSMKNQNNYQPTLLEEGTTAYKRVISKLDGSFKGADLVVDYSTINGTTESTEATEGSSAETTAPTTAPTTGGSTGETTAPATPTTGGESSGDSGTSSGGESSADPGTSSGGESSADPGTSSGGESSADSGTSSGDSGGSSNAGGDGSASGSDSGGSSGGESSGGSVSEG